MIAAEAVVKSGATSAATAVTVPNLMLARIDSGDRVQ